MAPKKQPSSDPTEDSSVDASATHESTEPIEPQVLAQYIFKEVEEDMKEAYLRYAMSTIIGRAIPDVRDGLKPVHRRILYAMYDMGIVHNKPFKKSARIVGEVLGKYHPHGDSAVYESMVRMVQTFALRYPLIDGQGNFGSVDGDSAAAMRYTEARTLSEGEEILADLDKETIEYKDNFDASLKEPVVLPSRFPNLLVNGSTGIAVGMATNMPPHNLTEICRAIIATIKNPEIELMELMSYVRGPDFPTGGIILGSSGIVSAYGTGRGKVQIRARALIEEQKQRKAIIITEIPYQVNKSSLLEEIADLVKDKRIVGIDDIRDESDREGMRIVIELKRDAMPDVILNQLYSFSKLQITFGIINLSIVDNQPKVLPLKGLIKHYIKHRKDMVVKRTQYDLKKAEERSHILLGLIIALQDIDRAIALIKKAASATEARIALISAYALSEIQANAILDMKLQRLTGLEQDKIRAENQNLLLQIQEFKAILASEQRVLDIIVQEVEVLISKYGDGRKTMIDDSYIDEDFDMEKLIKPENMVITISTSGYIKRLPLDTYKQQKRGGKGIIAADTADTDTIKHVFVANTHNYLLFFTDKGTVHWKKVYELPEASRQARGSAIVNMLALAQGERVTAYIPVSYFDDEHYLIMFTKQGTVKKTNLNLYSKPRKGGIIGINLNEGDELIDVLLTDGNKQLLLATKLGQAVKCHESDMRSIGRNSIGVRGISLAPNDEVIGAVIAPDHLSLLTITQNGYGKRSSIKDYRLINRGGKGVINIITNERNGPVVSVQTVEDDNDDVLLISRLGIIIRIPAKDISVIGRNTQGVRLMKLDEKDLIVSTTKVLSSQKEDAEIAAQEAELAHVPAPSVTKRAESDSSDSIGIVEESELEDKEKEADSFETDDLSEDDSKTKSNDDNDEEVL